MKDKADMVQADRIAQSIVVLRGHKVLLDETLAALYGVPTKGLVQALKRNIERFPSDFMFRLSRQDLAALRSQIVTSNAPGRGGRRYAPYAFTEQGVAMLSSVLKSRQAIAANIEIMRAFVRLRQMVSANRELAKQLDELERRVARHDHSIASLVTAIRELMRPSELKRRPIGFINPEQK